MKRSPLVAVGSLGISAAMLGNLSSGRYERGGSPSPTVIQTPQEAQQAQQARDAAETKRRRKALKRVRDDIASGRSKPF